MAHIITPADIAPFATIPEDRLAAMIEDAEALAMKIAPCLADPVHPGIIAAAKAIIRGAILRWHDAGSGAVTQQTSGPFSQTVDTTIARRGMFWPSEITDLQALCRTEKGQRAYSFTPHGGWADHAHYDACDTFFNGGRWCSCGSDLNCWRGPLWPGHPGHEHDPDSIHRHSS